VVERWYELPHHDGSPTYLPQPPQQLGDFFDVLLRVPAGSSVARVAVRHVHDGEPVSVQAWLDRTDPLGNRWYRATLRQVNPVTRYRFLTDGGPLGYQWITASGPCSHDPSDAGDFVSSVHPGGPEWLSGAIAYQIFPDRFARSGSVAEPPPDWAIPRPWADLPIPEGRNSARVFYGGDLYGVMQHLDHVASLGANLLYLTPVFPAPSNHRYNASTFDQIDPLLGGDAAYRALIEEAHRRGMRIIGDLTTNHTGSEHEWFRAASEDPLGPTAQLYYFTEYPRAWVGWMGHPALPKLNYSNPDVLRRMVTCEEAPVRRFLRPDFGLDGWRIDVANMTGRYGATDRNRDVAVAIRQTVLRERPDAYLLGEHFHDFLGDLDGAGWQGVMNYAGFSKPIWSWLTGGRLSQDNWMGVPRDGWPRLPGWSAVSSMQSFAAVGWQHRAASMNIISSHDSPRIRSITDDPALVEVAAGAMFTMPGVPMIWAGDEIGMEGSSGEDGRRPFPWHRPDQWDTTTLHAYRALAGARAGSAALQRGGLRWLLTDDDRLVFVRESAGETVLVLLARGPGPAIRIPTEALGLQDGQEFDRLYPVSAHPAYDPRHLPGDGPGVWIWRWSPARRAHQE
jgi:alpha-glucosidase